MNSRHWRWLSALAVATPAAILLHGCGGGDTASPQQQAMACDDTLKTAFKPDADTSVLLVKAFKKGDAVALANTPAQPPPPTAPENVCLVKILVGPGNSGPAGAPSTSAGIGIEVWLPEHDKWNERIRAWGNGGWAGSSQTDLTRIGGGDGNDLFVTAAGKGYVVATSDHGHTSAFGGIDGSFGLNPDGTINTTLWNDFAERSLHEMSVKAKGLAKLYYGKAHRFAYWDGYSTGGRQALKLAQVYPEDFDGILAGAPAINWTRFITNELYPQVAMQRELGAPIAGAKLSAVTSKAISACGGGTLGFLIDPYACRYDPTRDAAALCAGVNGSGGVVGTNVDAGSCVSLAEAGVLNRIWYGQTSDGSVPDPADDNASGPDLVGSKQLWFGLTRGSDLSALAGANAFPIATDQIAIEMQNSSLGGFFMRNALGNGANQWTTFGYADLTLAAYQGLALQPQFSRINTDNPDLAAFNNRKGKLLLYHGLADNLIAPQGSDNYYNRVVSAMGGLSEVQKFFRYYHIPGLPHSGRLDSAPPFVPVPQNVLGRDELFQSLQAWVEQGSAPVDLVVTSLDGGVSMPLCVYPLKATYKGTGSAAAAASYSCS